MTYVKNEYILPGIIQIKKNLQTLTTLHYKMVLYNFHKKKVPFTIQTNQELEKNLQWKIS